MKDRVEKEEYMSRGVNKDSVEGGNIIEFFLPPTRKIS